MRALCSWQVKNYLLLLYPLERSISKCRQVPEGLNSPQNLLLRFMFFSKMKASRGECPIFRAPLGVFLVPWAKGQKNM
jgi:hypothetical protein